MLKKITRTTRIVTINNIITIKRTVCLVNKLHQYIGIPYEVSVLFYLKIHEWVNYASFIKKYYFV